MWTNGHNGNADDSHDVYVDAVAAAGDTSRPAAAGEIPRHHAPLTENQLSYPVAQLLTMIWVFPAPRTVDDDNLIRCRQHPNLRATYRQHLPQ